MRPKGNQPPSPSWKVPIPCHPGSNFFGKMTSAMSPTHSPCPDSPQEAQGSPYRPPALASALCPVPPPPTNLAPQLAQDGQQQHGTQPQKDKYQGKDITQQSARGHQGRPRHSPPPLPSSGSRARTPRAPSTGCSHSWSRCPPPPPRAPVHGEPSGKHSEHEADVRGASSTESPFLGQELGAPEYSHDEAGPQRVHLGLYPHNSRLRSTRGL